MLQIRAAWHCYVAEHSGRHEACCWDRLKLPTLVDARPKTLAARVDELEKFTETEFHLYLHVGSMQTVLRRQLRLSLYGQQPTL